MRDYLPKILIISEFYFNENSGGGILLKNLFEDYPKDKIFILHEDTNVKTNSKIKSHLLKNQSKINYFLKKNLNPFIIQKLINFKNLITIKKGKRVSSDLVETLYKFKPDVIYTILGNYGLMCLIKDLKNILKVPLVTHIMDNVLAIYKNKSKDYEIFQYLIHNSSERIAINSKMAVEYQKIFKYKFSVLHNGVDRKKIQKVNLKKKTKIITYIGSIFKNAQLDSLIEITEVIKDLIKKNYDIKCLLFLPENQKINYEHYFPKNQNILIKNHNLNEKDYFKIISESDLLLLASNFDFKSIDYYKYSWPAKMGSYLMSNIPIFIYGPEKIFFINDAKKNKWAYVESKKSSTKLEKSLIKILYDSNLRKSTLKCAMKKSIDFELPKIQKKLSHILCSVKL